MTIAADRLQTVSLGKRFMLVSVVSACVQCPCCVLPRPDIDIGINAGFLHKRKPWEEAGYLEWNKRSRNIQEPFFMVFAQPGTFFEQNMVARAYLCTNKSLCMCTLYILQQRTVGRKKLWHLQQGRYKSPGNFPGILRRTKSQSDRNPASCSIIDCIRCANCTMFFMKPRPITEVELSGFSVHEYICV